MAGIYLHIPFCKKACCYCDFHFSTTLTHKKEVLQALQKEIELQQHFFNNNDLPAVINTLYFGGGTPSILQVDEIQELVDKVAKYFSIAKDAEITLEANPDDLTNNKLNELAKTPVNRLSIGIQSFNDRDLTFMLRSHNAKQALQCVSNAQNCGFNNISIDLIYGLPNSSKQQWEKNLQTTLSLNVQHVSAYCLTVEPKTALSNWVAKGLTTIPPDEKAIQDFEMAVAMLSTQQFVHYEISNFGKQNFFSQHNSNYWKQQPYLGIGPSAHSYNGKQTRQHNIANNAQYIGSLSKHIIPYSIENLTQKQQFNEYILIGLRTIWGINLQYIENIFGTNITVKLQKKINAMQTNNWFTVQNQQITLTNSGKLLADAICMQLFLE